MRAEQNEPCHDYYEVECGNICHECDGKVEVQWSGIACPCGHTWFCS